MKLYIRFLLLLFTLSISAQELQWAKSIRGSSIEYTYSVEIDNYGNSYTIGYHNGSLFVEYEPGEVIYNVYIYPNGDEIGIGRNGFLVKKDHDGNHMWHILLSEISELGNPYGVKIGTDGYLYACFINSRFLTESDNLQGITEYADFITILKLDLDGNEIDRFEYRNFGYWPNGNISARTFDVDHNNNFYIGGTFTGTVNLDLDHPEFDLVNTQNTNAMSYVMKISNSGNILWSKVLDIYNYGLHPLIKVTPDNNLLVVINSNVNIGNYDILIKLNSNNGNILWDKNLPNDVSVMDFDVLPNGNIPIVYETPYWLPINFGTYNNEFWTQGLGVVIWYDNQGNLINGYEYPYFRLENISVDGDNNTYIMANSYSNNYIDLDPTENEHIVEESFLGGGFFVKFDETTDFVTALTLGQSSESGVTPYYACNLYLKDLKVHNDNYYITGDYSFNCDFDPSNNTYFVGDATWNSTSTTDSFILKIGACEDITPSGEPELIFCENQNPTVVDLQPNQSYIIWYDSLESIIPLPDNTQLIDGQTYFAARQMGTCPESSERLEVLVTINSTPSPPQANSHVFCEGDYARLSDIIITGENIKWYNSLTSEEPLDVDTLLQNGGSYYATQTVNTCESEKTLIDITVIPVALPDVTPNQTFCIDDNATLNDIAITGENIKWYNAAINGNELPASTSLTDGMTYYASQTIDDCESLREAVTITIQKTPTPQGENIQTLCINQNPTLNDIVITGENIIWYDSLTETNPLPSSTLLTDGTTYYATQTINGCESVNRLAVTVELLESLNAFDYTEVVCDVANDNIENVNLSHYNSFLIQNHSEYSFEYYTSENGALNQTASAMITSYTEYPLNIGWNTIYIRIDSSFGCYNIVELKLQLVSSPIVAVSDIVALCEGKNVMLNAGIGFDSYLWSTGETSQAITVSQEGEYWVTVSQNNNNVICSTTKEISVALSTVAEITNIEIHDWTNSNNTIIIHVDGLGDYEYSVDGIFYQDSNVFNNLSSGPYNVYVRDKNQCGIVKEQIYLLSYPKYFTPNGDGIHDSWHINFSYYEPNLQVLIFDRYGKLLKELRQNESWDGKFNGNDMPSNDYWFVVKRNDGKIHKGHFALKR